MLAMAWFFGFAVSWAYDNIWLRLRSKVCKVHGLVSVGIWEAFPSSTTHSHFLKQHKMYNMLRVWKMYIGPWVFCL